jgi:pimeloyl-ACP methyl ester carboxylesterase
MPTARVNGIELYYEERGGGAPLLLLMGFGDDCHAWSQQVPAFAERYRTIAYDHRGVGKSAKPAGGYSIPQFAADALGLLDHLGLARAHLVGYSMGGRIAQYLAAHHPDRVAGLVLAATASRPNALNLYSLKAGAYLYETFGPEAAGAFGPLVSFTHAYFARHLPELAQALGRPAADPMPLHAYLGHVRAIEEHDTTAVLARIAAPTLVLLGDQEWLNPRAEADRLVRGIPGATLQVLSGGGHGFIWEIADAFNDAVLAFLAKVP